jgi:uncharacterized protein YbjT (DUF2867 family)
MFVIAGATGHTGRVVAGTLLAQGKPVTVVARDEAKAQTWREKGAEIAAASLDDPKAMAKALAGAEGAYLLIPPNYQAKDFLQYGSRVGDALAEAVKTSGIRHVVLLSSIGAQHTKGTGPIRNLHHAEAVLGPAARNLTILRAAYFQENWATGVDAARNQGVLHNFLTPDRKIPMIATADIGAIAAECLLSPANHGRRILELAGPEDYSPQDIANAFSGALGKPINLQTHPIDAVVPTLTSMGFPDNLAKLFREMIEGINSGQVAFETKGAELRRGSLTALETVKQLIGAPAATGSGGGHA